MLASLHIAVPGEGAAPASLRDLAQVRITHEMPSGIADRSGIQPAVGGIAVARRRADLIGRIQQTLLRALGEEVGVVALVILVFLLHARSALVPLATLPLVLLLTFAAMRVLGVPATVMSLGGIG